MKIGDLQTKAAWKILHPLCAGRRLGTRFLTTTVDRTEAGA